MKPTVSQEELIRAARKKLAEAHPDRGGSADDFVKVSEAYKTLKNPRSRAEYDLEKEKPLLVTNTLKVAIERNIDDVMEDGWAWWKEPISVLTAKDTELVLEWLDLVMDAAHRFHYAAQIKVGVYTNGKEYEDDEEYALIKQGAIPEKAMAELFVLKRKADDA